MNFFEIVVAMLMAILTGYSAAPAAKTAAVTVEAPAVVATARPQAVTRPKAAQPVAKPALAPQSAAASWPQPCTQSTYPGLSPAPTPFPGQFNSGGPGSVLTGTCPYLVVNRADGTELPNGTLIPDYLARCLTPLTQPYYWQERDNGKLPAC